MIDSIDPKIPGIFKEQVRIAAGFIEKLDRGEGLNDPIIARFVDQLSRTGFIDFLDNYLQLCLWAGKDPSEPYKPSFAYFIDSEDKAGGNVDGLVAKASPMTGYSVLHTGL